MQSQESQEEMSKSSPQSMQKLQFNTRYFNKFVLKKDGSVNKSSSLQAQKIIDEIDWYLKIPDDIKPFAAKMLKYNTKSKTPNYSLVYYKFPTLASHFITSSLPLSEWSTIIDRLFDLISMFKTHQKQLSNIDFFSEYYEKTIHRLTELEKSKSWKKLLAKKYIVINGRQYKNALQLMPILKSKFEKFILEGDSSVIHGDLCLSNILFNETDKNLILIDPKRWGSQNIYGDIKYDVAKLRQSFGSFYDFIIGDLFILKELPNDHFTFTITLKPRHKKISALFDKKLTTSKYNSSLIKIIESLLFLCMIPIHKENPYQQRAMYLTGVMLLNENIHNL